jgi:hypothetical protein
MGWKDVGQFVADYRTNECLDPGSVLGVPGIDKDGGITPPNEVSSGVRVKLSSIHRHMEAAVQKIGA